MIIRKTFSPRKVAPKGFTLVELLVVISIIALLLSILMPSLSKARESARKVKCMANVRSVGIVLSLYAQANKNCYPAGSYIASDGLDWGWSSSYSASWVCTLGIGGAKQIQPYLTGNPDIVFCPSNQILANFYRDVYKSDDIGLNVSYFPFCGRNSVYGNVKNKIRSPMKITDPWYLPVWGDLTSSNQGPAYNNHGVKGPANWTYVDGHVEAVRRENLILLYRNAYVKFLGPKTTR